MSLELGAVFLTLLVGMGPVKVAIVYVAETAAFSMEVRRRVALVAVVVAGIVGAFLLMAGALLAKLLHFSNGALAIAGGIVLLILGIRMILGQGGSKVENGPPKDPDALAVYPLGLPLLLNPVGIVALIAYSGSPDLVDIGIVAIAGLIVLAIDLFVLLGLARVGKISAQIVSVAEIVLGFLLAALAIQLMVDGGVEMGVITTIGTHT
jgi:multiple antibiotic resistance protein